MATDKAMDEMVSQNWLSARSSRLQREVYDEVELGISIERTLATALESKIEEES